MRRAWWLGVLMVACDFDAAYERRCDAGRCPMPVDAGSAGGQGGGATAGGQSGGETAGGQGGGGTAGGQGGGSMAGGQGGGATAGGQGGGATAGGAGGGSVSACPTGLAVEVNVPLVAPISATACVKLDVALTCQGARLDAGVPVQVQVVNTSTPQPRPATLYSGPGCTNSTTSAVTGDVYFDSRSGANGYMFGTYVVSVDAGTLVRGATRVVELEPGLSGPPFPDVLLPVNVCLTLPGISFVGLADAIPVLAPTRQHFTFTGMLPLPLSSCGGAVELVVNAGESVSSVMPRVTSSTPAPAGSGFILYGDAGQVSYLVRPCVTDGGTSSESFCCERPAVLLNDAGLWCR